MGSDGRPCFYAEISNANTHIKLILESFVRSLRLKNTKAKKSLKLDCNVLNLRILIDYRAVFIIKGNVNFQTLDHH